MTVTRHGIMSKDEVITRANEVGGILRSENVIHVNAAFTWH